MKKYLIFCVLILSCSSQNELFKYDNKNYIIHDCKSHIQANYSNVNEINNKSFNKIVIKNYNDKNLILFSTIIENPSMFYANKNLRVSGEKLIFKSFYRQYMNDAEHSGIKRFNFIVIKPNNSLVINLDDKLIKNEIKTVELNYLYFYSNETPNLIDIDNTILKSEKVFIKTVDLSVIK